MEFYFIIPQIRINNNLKSISLFPLSATGIETNEEKVLTFKRKKRDPRSR